MARSHQGWIKPFIALLLVLVAIPIVLAMLVFFYLFVASPVQITGRSMSPNYMNGQTWIIEKLSYRFSPPKRGDVIVYRAMENSEIDKIGRIIGMPNEQVSIANNAVFINGQRIQESYLVEQGKTYPGEYLKDNVAVAVPSDSFIMMGDNRVFSSDSRQWGPLPRGHIVGKLWFRY